MGAEEVGVSGRGKKKEGGGRGEEGVGRKVGKGGSSVKTKQSETPKKRTIMERGD